MLSLYAGQVAHQAGAYPIFCSIKRLRVRISNPKGWDASQLQGYPTALHVSSLTSTHLIYTVRPPHLPDLLNLAQEHTDNSHGHWA